MAVTLTKIPLSRLGKPLRACDPVSASCALDVHAHADPKHSRFGWIEPCAGYTTFNGSPRACMCNCHRERS